MAIQLKRLQTKFCKRCGLQKPETKFHRAAQRKDGSWLRSPICKGCAKLKAREYYLDNQDRLKEHNRLKAQRYREENPEYDRAMHLKRKYGLTIEEWDRLHDLQLGRCAICRLPLAEASRVCVDHEHETGEVRGLLCDVCNLGIGCFRDDPERCRWAAMYLEESRLKKGLESTARGGDPDHGYTVPKS
jgi:hypothetical protein